MRVIMQSLLGIPLLRGGSTIGVLLRVLYTTGNTITDKMKALLAEGTHFLHKPYTQNQLHDSVNNMLAA